MDKRVYQNKPIFSLEELKSGVKVWFRNPGIPNSAQYDFYPDILYLEKSRKEIVAPFSLCGGLYHCSESG